MPTTVQDWARYVIATAKCGEAIALESYTDTLVYIHEAHTWVSTEDIYSWMKTHPTVQRKAQTIVRPAFGWTCLAVERPILPSETVLERAFDAAIDDLEQNARQRVLQLFPNYAEQFVAPPFPYKEVHQLLSHWVQRSSPKPVASGRLLLTSDNPQTTALEMTVALLKESDPTSP
jgi:hypothetical protein